MNKKLWISITGVASLISLWFLCLSVYGLWNFIRLDTPCVLKIFEWKVDQKGSRYSITALYHYENKGKTFEGKSSFYKRHLNPYSADEQISKWQAIKEWKGWTSSWTPSYSSIEKIFPWKPLFNAIVTGGITAYFFILRMRGDLFDKHSEDG
jgi:hypothetical protein